MGKTNLENYSYARLEELKDMQPSPWSFLCACIFIEFLSKAHGKIHFKDFIIRYFPEKYKNFTFKDGKQNLHVQIYHVLRCGLVHSLSLTADTIGAKHGARDNSIVISNKGSHVGVYNENGYNELDAVRIVFSNFCEDIELSMKKLFHELLSDEKNNVNVSPIIPLGSDIQRDSEFYIPESTHRKRLLYSAYSPSGISHSAEAESASGCVYLAKKTSMSFNKLGD